MKTNLLTLVITLTVGIILAGSLLMPVISDTTTTEKTFENNGWFNLDKVSATDDDVTISWDHTEPTILTVNDETLTLPYSGNIPFTIVCGDDWGLRYNYPAANQNCSLDLYDSTGNIVRSASISRASDMSISLSAGVATFTVTGSTAKTLLYTECYYATLDGNYSFVLKKPTDLVYLNEDSNIFIVGRSSWSGGTVNVTIDGSIKSGFDITLTKSGWVATDLVVNATKLSEYVDLYTFKDLTFTVGPEDESESHELVYSQVIVPAKVSSELSQHLTDGEIAILNALPVLIIAALVVMAAGALYLKRDD